MESLSLDPRAQKVQTVAKVAGVGLVAVAAAGAITIAGASIIVASTVGVAALVMVNFVVPIAARSVAVWKQKSLTAIAETFSEETVREDERKEHERIELLEDQYVTSRSELEGAQEELRKQLKSATQEEEDVLKAQIAEMQTIIDEAEETLKSRKKDFIELQRVNKLYIALNRAGNAMQKAQGAERNSEEMQRITTARAAIKNKMRAAMAGKTIDKMNSSLKVKGEVMSDVLASAKGSKP